MTSRIALLASGAGTTAAAVIDACRSSRIPAEAVLLIGNNSRSGAFDAARSRDVPTVHLSGVTHPEPHALDGAMLDALSAAGATELVLAGYMKRLGPRVLGAFDGRILNTHPALLPAFGGQGMYGDRVHAAVLASSTRTTGATVHLVTAEYDEGPVLAQVEVPVEDADTVETLAARVQVAEKDLLVAVLAARAAAAAR